MKYFSFISLSTLLRFNTSDQFISKAKNTIMKKLGLILFAHLFCLTVLAQSGTITVTSVSQRTDGSGNVDIYFNLSGPGNSYNMVLEVSFNAGSTYTAVPANFLSGHVNSISPGNNKRIVWNGLGSFPNTFSTQTKLKLTANSTSSAPVAAFSGNPTSGTAPLLVNFSDQSANNPSSWFWEFGDGTTSTQRNPAKTYFGAGIYTVKLTATSSNGSNTLTKNNYISVSAVGIAPVAAFTGSPTSGSAPLSVNFTDQSANNPTIWLWEFGDGTTSNQQNPTKTYLNEGSYTVKLTAANTYGMNTHTKNNYITVNPVGIAPVAAFTGSPTSGSAPLTVNFTDQSTNNPTSWLWEFGDGTTSTQQNPSKTYQNVGGYNVILTATNSYGSNTHTKNSYITVSSSSGGNNLNDGLITYWKFDEGNGTTANDSHGNFHGTITGASWVENGKIEKSLSFGGNNTNHRVSIGTGINPTSMISGTFTAWINPTSLSGNGDGNHKTIYGQGSGTGGPSSYPFWIKIDAGGTNLTFNRGGGTSGITSTSTGFQTNQWFFIACTMDGTIGKIYINGQLKVSGALLPPGGTNYPFSIGNLGNTTTVYGNTFPGLIDECGIWNRALNQEEIVALYNNALGLPYPFSINIPLAAFTGSPTSGTAPLLVNFTDQSTNNPSSWLWEFGDGTNSTQRNPSKTYQNAGSYNVKLTATNSFGSNTHTKNNYITVTSGGGGTWPPGTVHCSGTPTAIVDVTNPATGKTWMDRNLGASRAATSSADPQAYGDLYQWGRFADGHQCRNSPTTSTLSSSDTPGHGNFILTLNIPTDWRSPQNPNLWQGVNGINNPCPGGYRLPTDAELNAERLSWSSNGAAGAFNSPLKLPVAGYRYYSNGSLGYVGSAGVYWSATVDGATARRLYFGSSFAGMIGDRRAYGYSIRCLKD